MNASEVKAGVQQAVNAYARSVEACECARWPKPCGYHEGWRDCLDLILDVDPPKEAEP